MRFRGFLSFLLLLAASFLIAPNPANSQQNSTSTMMTIANPSPGHCSILNLVFSAQAGKEIVGTFGADVAIDFYVLSQDDFSALMQAGTCIISPSETALFSDVSISGYENPYRTLPFPANGTYYFVFIYRNNGPTQLVSGYAEVELSYPSSITFATSSMLSTLSSSNVMMTSSSSTSAQPPPIATSTTTLVLPPQQTGASISPPCCAILPAYVWEVLLVLGIVIIMAVLAMRYRRRSINRTPTQPASAQQAQEVKYCGSCGAELAFNAKFCKKCGTAQ